MNGAAPMPPDPTGPPDSLFGLFVIGLVLIFGLLFVAAVIEQRKQERRNEQEALAEAAAQAREEFEYSRIQMLINQSPGGRKPWQ